MDLATRACHVGGHVREETRWRLRGGEVAHRGSHVVVPRRTRSAAARVRARRRTAARWTPASVPEGRGERGESRALTQVAGGERRRPAARKRRRRGRGRGGEGVREALRRRGRAHGVARVTAMPAEGSRWPERVRRRRNWGRKPSRRRTKNLEFSPIEREREGVSEGERWRWRRRSRGIHL